MRGRRTGKGRKMGKGDWEGRECGKKLEGKGKMDRVNGEGMEGWRRGGWTGQRKSRRWGRERTNCDGDF